MNPGEMAGRSNQSDQGGQGKGPETMSKTMWETPQEKMLENIEVVT